LQLTDCGYEYINILNDWREENLVNFNPNLK